MIDYSVERPHHCSLTLVEVDRDGEDTLETFLKAYYKAQCMIAFHFTGLHHYLLILTRLMGLMKMVDENIFLKATTYTHFG